MTTHLKNFACIIIAVAWAMCGAGFASAATYQGRQVFVLFMDTRDCVFFQLVGVSVADPSVGTTPWFALNKNGANFQTQLSILLSARTNGIAVSVATSGAATCGLAEVNSLGLYP